MTKRKKRAVILLAFGAFLMVFAFFKLLSEPILFIVFFFVGLVSVSVASALAFMESPQFLMQARIDNLEKEVKELRSKKNS